MREKKTVSQRQRRAIIHLLQGRTVRSTAKLVGVTEQTVTKWRSNPAFRLAFEEARQKAFDEAIAKLATMADVAVERLRDILNGKAKPDHGTLRTIEIVLREARSTEEVAIRQAIRDLKDSIERR